MNCNDADLELADPIELPIETWTQGSFHVVFSKIGDKDADWRRINGQANGKHNYETVLAFE